MKADKTPYWTCPFPCDQAIIYKGQRWSDEINWKGHGMANLTDCIEEYLKKLLALSSERYVEVQRRQLAKKFACVPSQINYVLERRFSPDRGYLVESRRGGGGWIRIFRIETSHARPWREVIESLNGREFEPSRIRQLLKRMYEEKIISRRESSLLETVIKDRIYEEKGLSKNKARELQHELLSEALEELLKVNY